MSSPEKQVLDASPYRHTLRWQTMATLAVAVIAAVSAGFEAGISALLGGMAVTVGALIAAKIAEKSRHNTEPMSILFNLLKAEVVKIIIIAIILFVVFKLFKELVPFALIAGLAAAAFFSGAALAKSQVKI